MIISHKKTPSSVAAGLLLLAGSVSAEPLSFDAALALAEQSAPSLAAESDNIAAARSSVVSADQLPDPRLVVGIENLPISGPPAWTLDEESMTMGRVGVMQEVPNRAKRRARHDVAEANVARAEADREIERLRVRRETALAWLNRYYLERKEALFDDLERENRLLAEGVSAQVAAGQASAPDTVMPKQEAAMLADRRDELQLDIAKAKATLRRWVGDAADALLAGTPPRLAIDHEHLRHRLENHPELAAFASMNTVARAQRSEERRVGKECRSRWSPYH